MTDERNVVDVLAIAVQVARDHRQRALPILFDNAERLEALREQIRDGLARHPDVDGLSVSNVHLDEGRDRRTDQR